MNQPFIQTLSGFYRRNRYSCWIVALILLVFWPFTFGIYIPKWDNIDAYLPYRHAVGEFLLNGYWPLWHPYMHLGNTAYADLQSGAWSPVVWIITFLGGGYGIRSLIAELMLCYIVAGLGMFRLAKSWLGQAQIAFLLAISYALSGFMVGSSQLMVFLWGLAWLPWCIHYLRLTLIHLKLRHALALAICFSLHLTSASPAFTIVLTYFLTGVTAWYLLRQRKENYPYKKAFGLLPLAALTAALLSLPYLNAFYEFSPYFNRLAKLSLDRMLVNPFTPQSYISYILPYTTVAHTEVFSDTDLSLRNGYFGILALCAATTALVFFKIRHRWWWLAGIVISLALASGWPAALYKFVSHLPGFGNFRHPSLFRSYTIFLALLAAGAGLQNLLSKNLMDKWIRMVFFMLSGAILAGIIGLWGKTGFTSIADTVSGVIRFKEFSEAGMATHIAINLLVLAVILLTCWILYRTTKQSALQLTVVATILEFLLLTTLLAPTTVYIPVFQKEVAAFIRNLPDSPTQDFNTSPLNTLSHQHGFTAPPGIWRNLSVYYKQPAFDGYNPLQFADYEIASREGTIAATIENPILYVPQKHAEQPPLTIDSGDLQPGLIWGVAPFEPDSSEMILNKQKISFNRFETHVNNPSDKAQWLVLNQNYHHQWHAQLAGTALEIKQVNNMVMGVLIPGKTEGVVEWEYQSPRTTATAILAFLCWIIAISGLIYFRNKNETPNETA